MPLLRLWLGDMFLVHNIHTTCHVCHVRRVCKVKQVETNNQQPNQTTIERKHVFIQAGYTTKIFKLPGCGVVVLWCCCGGVDVVFLFVVVL